MPTLRQKVDSFCKDASAKVESTDKLRAQITTLKSELTKSKEAFKNHMKQMKAASKTAKVAKPPKAPAAPKVKQAVAMNPLPPAMPQTATVTSAGRRTRRRRHSRRHSRRRY